MTLTALPKSRSWIEGASSRREKEGEKRKAEGNNFKGIDGIYRKKAPAEINFWLRP